MKALTLWQPWASLVAEGVKRVETRSWSTEYRGPLAIHAAVRKPKPQEMKSVVAENLFAWNAWYGGGYVNADGSCDTMPRGVVIATCTLTHVVPIAGPGNKRPVYRPCVDDDDGGLCLWDGVAPLPRDIEGQRPFGDFTPGRYAWLLDDIVKLDIPVAARGHQTLWEWDAEVPA